MFTLTTDEVGAALLLGPLVELEGLKENETLVWTAFSENQSCLLGCDAYLVTAAGKITQKFNLHYIEDSGILLHLRTMDLFALRRLPEHSPDVETYTVGSQNQAIISLLRTYIPAKNQRDLDVMDQ